jgi:hypothetical protein
MPNTITPSDQKQFLDPYQARLFSFDNVNSRVYLTKEINSLLNTLGSDIIIYGLIPENFNYDINTHIVTFDIPPGKCIIDSTLIEITEMVQLEINVNTFDQNGYLIISLAYQYLQTVYANNVRAKVSYLDTGNNITFPETWYQNIDRLLLDVLVFDKTAHTVSSITNRDPLLPPTQIDIEGNIYNVADVANHIKDNLHQLREVFYY